MSAWKGNVTSADAATACTPKNEAAKIMAMDGGNEISEEISVSRTLPTATSTGYVRHAANSASEAMQSTRTSGTISIQVGPNHTRMILFANRAIKIRKGQCNTLMSEIASR